MIIWQSLKTIFETPGDLFGVLLFAGLAWAGWQKRRQMNWLYIAIPLGLLLAAVWRGKVGAMSGRYHNIFIFPALFFGFYLIWYGPWPRKIAICFLAAAAIMCIGKDIRNNPYEAQICEIYRKIEQDAQKFNRPNGLSFSKLKMREQYYTRIPVYSPERRTTLTNHLAGLHDNLAIFAGEYDAVYIFLESAPTEKELINEFAASSPGHMTTVGQTYLSNNHKKILTVLRYLPEITTPTTMIPGELLPNGDFAKLLPPDREEREIKRLSQKAPRFALEKARIPDVWRLYQSTISVKVNSFASVTPANGKNVLVLDAEDSYLVAISPSFPVAAACTISFELTAKTDSVLQISRSLILQSNRSDLYPLLIWRIAPGTSRRYDIHLPARPDAKSGELWFWLHSGKIELSDVRIK